MRFRTADFITPCGCRSVGECKHNSWAEIKALYSLVDAFADVMKYKLLLAAVDKMKSGWNDPRWSEDEIVNALREHVDKGDPVDVANFAAFLWNRK